MVYSSAEQKGSKRLTNASIRRRLLPFCSALLEPYAEKAGTETLSVPASFFIFSYLTYNIYSRPADKSKSRLGSFASVYQRGSSFIYDRQVFGLSDLSNIVVRIPWILVWTL